MEPSSSAAGFTSLARTKPSKKYLTAVRCPVLAVWGEDDTLVPARKSAFLHRQYLRVAGNTDVTTVVFANADHSIDDFALPYRKVLTRWLQDRFGT